jgi:hypothetical protein
MGAKVRHNRDNRRQPPAFRRPEIFLQIVSIKIHNSPICVSVLRLERRDKERRFVQAADVPGEG